MKQKISEFLKTKRNLFNLSQVELAIRSGVSLPTIQNIEAGKANPSISVLEKLVNSFGYKIIIIPVEPDWKKLAKLGLPLNMEMQAGKMRSVDISDMLRQIELASEFISFNNTRVEYQRYRDAFKGFLLAFRTHYTSIFNRITHPFAHALTRETVTGRDIKSRNTALEIISRYL